ncbi:MAG: MBOAT family protein [Proteobacteria bacterium]|nr:MBOAT family protein [Pseudomonadota bacterium]
MVTSHLLTLLFALCIVAVYYLLPGRFRWFVLLTASIIFYLSAEPLLLLLAVGTACWTWWIGKKITNEHAKRWLVLGIVPCILSLFIFKYFNFFYTSITDFLALIGLPVHADVIKLALPLGISYYTFKLIGYLVDIYRNKYKPEAHLGYFLTYTLYFPQIVCGPIQRADDFLTQINQSPRFDASLFNIGIRRIILGLFKILVIANPILPYLDRVSTRLDTLSGMTLLSGSILYSILIYADFSGCSDIAIGTGNLFGLKCPDNFKAPYFSKNIVEFWKRWHISLTSWLKDYIYISLGGNRVGTVRTKLNILITFLVSGLWHGANWTFIFWGLIHGIWNVLTPRHKKKTSNTPVILQESSPNQSNAQSASLPKAGNHLFKKLKSALAILATFMGVTIGWQFFRSDNISSAFHYLYRTVTEFHISSAHITEALIQFTGDSSSLPIFLTFAVCICIYGIFEKSIICNSKYDDFPIPLGWTITFFVIMILFGQFGKSAFLYANF